MTPEFPEPPECRVQAECVTDPPLVPALVGEGMRRGQEGRRLGGDRPSPLRLPVPPPLWPHHQACSRMWERWEESLELSRAQPQPLWDVSGQNPQWPLPSRQFLPWGVAEACLRAEPLVRRRGKSRQGPQMVSRVPFPQQNQEQGQAGAPWLPAPTPMAWRPRCVSVRGSRPSRVSTLKTVEAGKGN